MQVQVLSPVPNIKREALRLSFYISVRIGQDLNPSKCNADERCRRGLDRGEPLFSAPKAENANQVLSPVPEPDTSFDTMRIEVGVQFLFAKALINFCHHIKRKYWHAIAKVNDILYNSNSGRPHNTFMGDAYYAFN